MNLLDALKAARSLGVGTEDDDDDKEYSRGAIELLWKIYLPDAKCSEAKQALTLILDSLDVE